MGIAARMVIVIEGSHYCLIRFDVIGLAVACVFELGLMRFKRSASS